MSVMSLRRQSAKVISTLFGNSMVAMETNLWRHMYRSMVDSVYSANFQCYNRLKILSTVTFGFLKQIILLLIQCYQCLDTFCDKSLQHVHD